LSKDELRTDILSGDGRWRMADDRWQMADEGWQMKDGR